jgi:hypothetical protein
MRIFNVALLHMLSVSLLHSVATVYICDEDPYTESTYASLRLSQAVSTMPYPDLLDVRIITVNDVHCYRFVKYKVIHHWSFELAPMPTNGQVPASNFGSTSTLSMSTACIYRPRLHLITQHWPSAYAFCMITALCCDCMCLYSYAEYVIWLYISLSLSAISMILYAYILSARISTVNAVYP